MMRCDISQGPLFIMKTFFCSVFDGRQTEQGPPFSQGWRRKKIQPCGSFVFMHCQVILLVLQQGSDCMVPPFMTKTLRRYFPLLWRPPEKHPPSGTVFKEGLPGRTILHLAVTSNYEKKAKNTSLNVETQIQDQLF